MSAFKAPIGGRFAPLATLVDEDADLDSMATHFYKAVTDTAAELKRKIRTELKMAKETWIQGQCQEVEARLRKNNSKKEYQLVKDLTTEKQGKSTTIQLYTYKTDGGPIVLVCPQIPDEEHHPILREEVEAAVKSAEDGKVSRHG